MMNANVKPRFRPRTASELLAEVSEAERSKLEAERGRNSARAALPALLVSGDADAIAQGRSLVQSSERALHIATEALADLREAHRLAQTQERQREAAQSLRELEDHERQIRTAATAIDSALDIFGESLRELIATMNSKDALLSSLGVNPDHWLLRAKLDSTIGLHIWLASGGRLGEKRGLDNAHQVQQSGAASVGRLAKEAAAVELRSIRAALGIVEPSPPRVA